MKSPIEYFILNLVLMFGILFTFSFYGVYHQNHRAHAFRDQVANLVENFDGNLSQVDQILMREKLCQSCTYTTTQNGSYIEITVNYQIELKVLNLSHQVQIKGLSYLPPKSS